MVGDCRAQLYSSTLIRLSLLPDQFVISVVVALRARFCVEES